MEVADITKQIKTLEEQITEAENEIKQIVQDLKEGKTHSWREDEHKRLSKKVEQLRSEKLALLEQLNTIMAMLHDFQAARQGLKFSCAFHEAYFLHYNR